MLLLKTNINIEISVYIKTSTLDNGIVLPLFQPFCADVFEFYINGHLLSPFIKGDAINECTQARSSIRWWIDIIFNQVYMIDSWKKIIKEDNHFKYNWNYETFQEI